MVWAIVILSGAFLLLPVMHFFDWVEFYLQTWYWLKNNLQINSDLLIRVLIIAVVILGAAIPLLWIRKLLRSKTNHKHKVRILQFTFVYAALALIEVVLVWQGFYPGSLYRNFRIVNQLHNLSTQFSDEMGIIRYLKNGYHPADFRINNEGFRSKYEYDSLSINRLRLKGEKIVMVVGDSYVAGHTATPITNCFSDLLDSDSIATLNFGMTGTDPAQYEMICEKYLPVIKPDLVIVCIYANDFLAYKRLPSPGIPIMYRTNASPNGGMIFSQKPLSFGFAPNNLFTTAEEAYKFYLEHFSIRKSNHFATRFCSYSSFLTMIYNSLFPAQFPSKAVEVTGKDDARAQQILFNHLKEIERICTQINTRCLFFGIPANGEKISSETYEIGAPEHAIFIKYPTDFDKSDYSTNQGDGHFNNKGHSKYLRFLLKETGLRSQKNNFSTSDYRQ